MNFLEFSLGKSKFFGVNLEKVKTIGYEKLDNGHWEIRLDDFVVYCAESEAAKFVRIINGGANDSVIEAREGA